MENIEDSEATPLLRGHSRHGRSNQLICLMICAVGCIVTTGLVLLWYRPVSIQGGEEGTLGRREEVRQGWLYVIIGIFAIYVIYYLFILFRNFVKRFG